VAFINTYNFKFKSNADIVYLVEFWDQGANAGSFAGLEGTLGKNAAKIAFGSEGSKMYAPLKASTCTIDFMVTDIKSALYIRNLKNERQERDVYVYVYATTNGLKKAAPIFAGYILVDLSDDPDQAVPYGVNIKAVDGLAALKYYDFIPSTTPQNPDHLYEKADTYVATTFPLKDTFIQQIRRILEYSGYASTPKGVNRDAEIQTSLNWYNGNMVNSTSCPLGMSRVSAMQFYNKEGDTGNIKYKPLTCYDALVAICKTWGMRCFVWDNTFYFIQINMYSKNNAGNIANTTNIPYHRWEIAIGGAYLGSGEKLDIDWGKYFIPVHLSQINKKLEGSQYGVLPAYKKVTIDFMNVSNINYFQAFPLPPNPWPTAAGSGGYVAYEPIGVFTFDGINSQTFYQEIWLQFINNSGTTIRYEFGWTIQVQPVGSGGVWYSLGFYNWPTIPQAEWFTTSGAPLYNTYYGYGDLNIPTGTSSHNATQTNSPFASGIPYIVCDPAFFTAGDWEFRYKIAGDWNASADPHYNQQHGRCDPLPAPSGPYFTDPDSNSISYINSTITAGIGASMFSPIINGAVGTASTNTAVIQAGDDTAFEEVNGVLWGDIQGINTPSNIEVYTGIVGTPWVESGFGGFWGIETLAGTNSLAETLAEQIFARQAKNVQKFSTKIITDLKYQNNDGSGVENMYPAPFTRYYTPSHMPSATFKANWIMHTGTFELVKDEWSLNLYEFKTFATDTTSTTTTTNGSNTGGVGNGTLGGKPLPTEGPAGKFAAPTTTTTQELKRLSQSAPKVIAKVSADQGRDPLVGPQIITSISVQEMPLALLKAGDTIMLQPQDKPRIYNKEIEFGNVEFVLSADQLAGATSLSVVAQSIDQNITIGDVIVISQPDLISQYQHKTKGSVAGFSVDNDGLTKGGIEIIGWTDSDTMEGSDLDQKLPTTESVKNYIDNEVAGSVTSIIAGTNITISPTGGTGAVTINSSGGGGTSTNESNTSWRGSLLLNERAGIRAGIEYLFDGTNRGFEFDHKIAFTGPSISINQAVTSAIHIVDTPDPIIEKWIGKLTANLGTLSGTLRLYNVRFTCPEGPSPVEPSEVTAVLSTTFSLSAGGLHCWELSAEDLRLPLLKGDLIIPALTITEGDRGGVNYVTSLRLKE